MSPTASPSVPLPTTPWRLEPESRQREDARPIQVNVASGAHDVLLSIIIVATGMPLRATGDYSLGRSGKMPNIAIILHKD